MHPFEIKPVLLAKHARALVLIHFSIVRFIAGVAFDFLAQWKKERLLSAAAYYNLFAAALMTIPALTKGLPACQRSSEPNG